MKILLWILLVVQSTIITAELILSASKERPNFSLLQKTNTAPLVMSQPVQQEMTQVDHVPRDRGMLQEEDLYAQESNAPDQTSKVDEILKAGVYRLMQAKRISAKPQDSDIGTKAQQRKVVPRRRHSVRLNRNMK